MRGKIYGLGVFELKDGRPYHFDELITNVRRCGRVERDFFDLAYKFASCGLCDEIGAAVV